MSSALQIHWMSEIHTFKRKFSPQLVNFQDKFYLGKLHSTVILAAGSTQHVYLLFRITWGEYLELYS